MNGVLFDLDGVLVDVSESYDLTIKKVVERFAGRAATDEEIQARRWSGGLNSDWDLAESIVREAGGRVERRELVAFFQETYRGRNFDGLILRGTPLLRTAILRALRRKFRLGIVTGRPRDETAFTLERFGMAKSFSAVVTMDDLPRGRGKPDPLGLRLALKALDLSKAVYVGDTVDDIEAARRAGLPAVAVIKESPAKEEGFGQIRSRGAAVVLADVNDILEVT
ncbi:MAG: hypothetical protein A2W03_12190 [Candidatus Aminicenantes bacterium RBG_16_63_16]|nr:MAG: hypothetical protein A2W03_12190 [Candidatus Aminicenantes bacterium RBG_16_63_16]